MDMEEDNRKLYPMKFIGLRDETSWGSVDYLVADLGFKDSMVDNGWFGGNTLSELMGTYLERVTGDDAFEYYGLQFPILVKVIETKDWQPLQVNVADQEAAERYDSFGKTVLWYILEAEKGSGIRLGFRKDVEPAEFYRRCQEGKVEDILECVHPSVGDSILIKPGTVFAAGPGLRILEISECSELSFNLHGWGKETEGMMLEEAFDLIDYSPAGKPAAGPNASGTVEEGGRKVLSTVPEFTVTRIDLADGLHIFSEHPGSFAIYFCERGEAIIQTPSDDGGQSRYSLKAGQCILVPSEVNDFFIFPAAQGTRLLEVLTEKRVVRDPYVPDEAPDPHIKVWN